MIAREPIIEFSRKDMIVKTSTPIKPRASSAIALLQPDSNIDLWSRVDEGRRRITLHNQHISPLLRLPAEVRNIIYVLVLGNRTYRFHDAVSRPHAKLRTNNECHVLALLLVSHQIYAEARLLPYSLNTFSFRECEISLMPFLAHRHLAHLRAIRFIELVTFQAARMWAAPNVNSGYKHLVKVRLLERLPNLTQIKVLVYGYSTLYVNSSMLSIEPSFTKIGENQRRLEEMVMNVREDVIVRFFWV